MPIKTPESFPLSYFADSEPFATWFRSVPRDGGRPIMHTSVLTGPQPGTGFPTFTTRPEPPGMTGGQFVPSAHPWPPAWTETVHLERFSSRRIERGAFSGSYQYLLQFSATQEIVIDLPQPPGLAVLFGGPVKENQIPDRVQLRYVLDPKTGGLNVIEVTGAMRFRLPRGLVCPVKEFNGRWVDAQPRYVVVPLAPATLRWIPGKPMQVTRPLVAPDLLVRIGQTDLVARLGHIEFSGTANRPTISFTRIRLVYQRG